MELVYLNDDSLQAIATGLVRTFCDGVYLNDDSLQAIADWLSSDFPEKYIGTMIPYKP